MRVIGVDFTSAPSRSKPITCLNCSFYNGTLRANELESFPNFEGFEGVLRSSGPWILGVDFPFGFSRKFLRNAKWPMIWKEYVEYARSLGREGFVKALEDYKSPRKTGDKEHRRKTDDLAASISPQKLYGVPVAKMFFEGAPRLIDAGVHIPHLANVANDRVVVEAYPGVLARCLVGRASYKSDAKRKQTSKLLEVRRVILDKILDGALDSTHPFRVEANSSLGLTEDPTGDKLDALLCAIQAAWAWNLCEYGFGAPSDVDVIEGWIAHPMSPSLPKNLEKKLREIS